MSRRAVRPPPDLPPGFDPDDRSWHGYKRTWKSDAVWVDLRPVRPRIDAILRDRSAAAQRSGRGKGGDRGQSGLTEIEMGQAVSLCGQVAFALLVGGRLLGRGEKSDVQAQSGRVFEVKTTFKYYPFERWPPKVNANPRSFPENDLVMASAEGYPQCFDRACVVGWLPKENLFKERVRASWGGWTFPWKDGEWRSVYEIMQDELAEPEALPGMPGRRHGEDPGLIDFIRHYVGNPDA